MTWLPPPWLHWLQPAQRMCAVLPTAMSAARLPRQPASLIRVWGRAFPRARVDGGAAPSSLLTQSLHEAPALQNDWASAPHGAAPCYAVVHQDWRFRPREQRHARRAQALCLAVNAHGAGWVVYPSSVISSSLVALLGASIHCGAWRKLNEMRSCSRSMPRTRIVYS